jgi:pyruvate dehydrogenase E2 component (dihydrolipoamide acetyltransferase)
MHIARNIDATGLARGKRSIYQESSKNISFTDLILFSVARVLTEFPEIAKGSQRGVSLEINVAFAVATRDDNVVTPVIPGANLLPLLELSQLRRELTGLALLGKLRPRNLEGGAFTVTNLGMEGADFFAPIINAPQRAILAVGRIAEQPVVNKDRIEIGWRMWASLAADHRHIDGAMAARFLSRWQEHLHKLPEELSK